VQLLRILLRGEVECELLDPIQVLLPPELDEKRRQDGQYHAQAVDAGMATAADSNKVAILGDPRPPMMDGKGALAASWTAARLAKAAVPHPDPFAMAAKEATVEPVSGVAAPAEATRRDRPVPADPTPEVPLPLARGRRLRHRLNRRHPRTPFLAGLLDQRQITPTDFRP
jgi:hypothetical protein